MARIRTIKPRFFRHYELYKAEQETGLPLRVAFAGLWTCADREGRFRWVPVELKLDCLPYDEVDFSRVLDALTTRGFLVKYASEGREYGLIPSFTEHQIINNREAPSELPEPPELVEMPITSTREARDNDASATRHDLDQGEGKGKDNKYKYEGQVIRLVAKDYDSWRAQFGQTIPDFDSELKRVDLALVDKGQSKGWFSAAYAMLNHKHQENLKRRPAGKPPPAKRPMLDVNDPDFNKRFYGTDA